MINNLKLLGKPLSEYEKADYFYTKKKRCVFPDGKEDWNVNAIKCRLKDNFERECLDLFVFDGNEINTTSEIIAMVHLIYDMDILTPKQWEQAIPVIEKGLTMNKEYVKLLDNLYPFIEDYCKRYGDCARYTLMKRFKLEFWQGRFCDPETSLNIKQRPNYK